MLKKKCFAALSGILLAITVIAPFSFSKVNADSSPSSTIRVLYSFDASSTDDGYTYLYADFIFTSNYLCSGSLWVKYNNSITTNSYGLYSGNGINSNPSYTSANPYRTYTITFENTGFFIWRVVFKGQASVLNAQVMQNPGSSATNNLGISFGLNNDIVYTTFPSNEIEILTSINTHLNAIQFYSSSISSSVSSINSRVMNIMTSVSNIQNKVDTLVNGNTASNNAANENDQLNNEASSVIDDYDQLNSTFDSNFNDSQEDIQDIMSNSSLTQFSDAAIWFTQQLASLYTSMGDMQILVTLPLLLGIALFFIGRGNVIFRDPNTEQWSSGTNYVYDENGNSHVYSYTNYRVTERRRTKDGGK